MAIEKIKTEYFLSLSKDHPVFDVRSPAEFCRYLGIADSGEPSARQIYEFAA